MARKTRRRRRADRGPARARAPVAYEGVEAQSRDESGVVSSAGTGLITELGSSATTTHPDRVAPDRPPAPETAAEVERSDHRRHKTRAADPHDGATERARDVIDKGGDPDGAALE